MYSNTGEKISNLAQIFVVLGIIASIITGIMFGVAIDNAISEDGVAWLIAFFVMGVGCFVSYLAYILLAGYGELISNTQGTCEEIQAMRRDIAKIDEKRNTTEAVRDAKEKIKSYADEVEELISQYRKGMITEEEFNAMVRREG